MIQDTNAGVKDCTLREQEWMNPGDENTRLRLSRNPYAETIKIAHQICMWNPRGSMLQQLGENLCAPELFERWCVHVCLQPFWPLHSRKLPNPFIECRSDHRFQIWSWGHHLQVFMNRAALPCMMETNIRMPNMGRKHKDCSLMCIQSKPS